MESLRHSFQSWLDRLDLCWKALPIVQKRRIVLYSFAGYVLVTLGVVAQVIYEFGHKCKSLPIEHINNPVAKVKPNAAGRLLEDHKNRNHERK
ncbi:MAG: nitrogen regulatory IIA protein [Flavobacterium psychrophilum]|nr:MAG: nitrogen regulatory IIA protein [Flavobacterium psychrophilum]